MTSYNEKNAGDFINGVETAMAHMSHDGSSLGDEITLSSVDFSGIEPPSIGNNDKNRVIINNLYAVEFDDEIEIDGQTYSGTIQGDKAVVERQKDGTCVVRYYDSNDENANVTQEITYSPNRERTNAIYSLNKKGNAVLVRKHIQDENGKTLSEYRSYGNYAIETKNTDSGLTYVAYDENEAVTKCTSINEDESGVLNIATYSDRNESKQISEDKCLRYTTDKNHTKYKFSTGNQSVVNFTDTEENIAVNVSRGSLKAEYNVTKGDNNTYTFNGKQYYSMEELAAELNGIELQASDEPDGDINVSKQGFGVGNCGILSAINALSYTEYGRDVLNDAFEYGEDGSVTIHFNGIGRSYTISSEEIESTDYFSNGDKDMIAFELAMTKGLADIANGNIGIDSGAPYWCKRPNELYSESFLITATWPQEVFYMLTGQYCSIDDHVDNYTKQSWLNELQENDSIAISVATFVSDGSSVLRTDTESCYVPGRSVNDAFGNQVGIVTGHAYAVKEVNTKANGERVVTIVNPWDSGEEIVLDENTYLNTFEIGYSMEMKDNFDYPQYYY